LRRGAVAGVRQVARLRGENTIRRR